MLGSIPQQKSSHMDGLDAAVERPSVNMIAFLRRWGIRPTRQRLSFASILFSKGNRHITVEALQAEARAARVQASYATMYNVLKRFTEAGLLRSLAVEGQPMVFDTNVSPHHHFFFEDSAKIVDVAFRDVAIVGLPQPPEGYEIARVDVVIRLRPNASIPRSAKVSLANKHERHSRRSAHTRN